LKNSYNQQSLKNRVSLGQNFRKSFDITPNQKPLRWGQSKDIYAL